MRITSVLGQFGIVLGKILVHLLDAFGEEGVQKSTVYNSTASSWQTESRYITHPQASDLTHPFSQTVPLIVSNKQLVRSATKCLKYGINE